MTLFATPAATIWRDYATDAVPSSGAHRPLKSQIRAWGAIVETLLQSDGVINAEAEYGVLGDASTDNTAAFNAIIAYANANPNTTVILPAGDILISSSLNAITATGLYFVARGAMNSSRISHYANPCFTWSSGASYGGCVNIGFNNIGTIGAAVTHRINGGDNLLFKDIYCETTLSTFADIGETNAVSNVVFAGFRGVCANDVAAPFFKIRDCVNFTYHDGEVRPVGTIQNRTATVTGTLATATGKAVAGRYFLEAPITAPALCDITRLIDSDISEFYGGLSATITGNTSLGPLIIDNCVFEQSVGLGIAISLASSTSRIVDCAFQNTWFKTNTGDGIEVSGTGRIQGLTISNCRILESAANGVNINVSGAVEDLSIDNLKMYNIDTGTSAAGAAGVRLLGGTSWKSVTLNSCKICADSPAGITTANVPDYGIYIVNAIPDLMITGNRSRGSVYGLYAPVTLDSPTIVGNVFISDTADDTTPVSLGVGTITGYSGLPIVHSNNARFDIQFGTTQYFKTGQALNFGNSDVTGTHGTNTFDWAGASLGYGFDAAFRGPAPVTVTGSTHTLAETTNTLIANRAGSVEVTLPTASSWTGRRVFMKTIQNQTIISASSNVIPKAGGAAGTAIVSNTAGNWAVIESNGTNWEIIAGT